MQFERSSCDISESAQIVSINVIRNGSTSASASVSYSVIGGTAVPGGDFTGGAGILRFNVGATVATLNLTIINDAIYEGNEKIVLLLSNPVNVSIGNNLTTVNIIDDDAPPTIKFSASSYTIRENQGTVTFPVYCNGSSSLPASIGYSIIAGSATAGIDYSGSSGTLSFAPGTTVASFSVSVVNDAIYEGNETIMLTLSNPANATIGTPSTAIITVQDDDAIPALQFGATQYIVNEGVGSLSIIVKSPGSTSLPASVNYAVAGGNATAVSDYTGGTGTLSFAPGATAASFSLSIVNDNVYEGNQTIILSLSSPVNSVIGANGTATVVILNDDAVPTLRFSASAYNVYEDAGKATISVSLTGNTELYTAVNYAVTGGNAMAGTDYTGGSGTLSFSPGTTNVSFDINMVTDSILEGNESIVLMLSSPQNAIISSPSATMVTILNDDAVPTFNFSLVAGWNLISLPLTPQNSSISAVFPDNVRASLVNIWGWDEARQNWVYYSPDSNDYFYQYYPALNRLETGKAYWVEMNQPASFTLTGLVPGNAPSSPTVLVSDWNFIGPTGLSAVTPAAMYPAAIDVWGWDAARQNWVYYSPDSNDYFYQYYDKINTIQTGLGYWVEMA